MDYSFKDWQKILADFQSSVEKDLQEIRKHKAEVQRMKAQVMDEINNGKYIRDERRIVLSAPEIFIGNLDKNGNLISNGSSIVIRSNTIGMDGVGDFGSVRMRAPQISQIAVDSGFDGNEAVVPTISSVTTQARSITIEADKVSDTFIPSHAAPDGGINIHADTNLDLSATIGADTLKKNVDASITTLKELKSTYSTKMGEEKKRVEDVCKIMEKLMADADKKRGKEDEDIRNNYIDLEEINKQLMVMAPELTKAIESYSQYISKLAETNRQIKSLDKSKGAIKTGDDYKKKTTGTSLNIKSESVFITSTDGDGNLRDNAEAIVNVVANKMMMGAVEHDGSLKKSGNFFVNAKNIGISTADTKLKDGKEGSSNAVGKVTITSKNITMQALDNDVKDRKLKEKALTKDSKLDIRMEKTILSATDTEGKATGSVKVNSKLVEVKAMDVDKEKRTDKELAKDSKMLLLAEKMFVGARDKKVKSKKVQAMSEEIGLFADKTLEAQQDEKKAVLQLADGKAALSGSETQVYGKTTINAATEVKGEVKAPKATIDSIQAKSQFKSPNISDGMAAGGGGGGGSLSAKLTAEDGPKEA